MSAPCVLAAGAGGGSLADHVARDSGVRVQGEAQGPALTEEEFRMASGAFDPDKYEEYNRQVGGWVGGVAGRKGGWVGWVGRG